MLVGVVPVTTARLRGDRPLPADLEPWSAVFLDERIDEDAWPEELRTPEEALRIHDLDRAHWEKFGFGPWSVRERDTEAYVGRIGLAHTRATGRPEVQVVWFVDHDRAGAGYATEMAREAIRVGFEVLDLDELIAYTMVTNDASRRVAEKLEMAEEDEFDHEGLPHVLYRLRRG